jgi:membrane protease YdiL (CAAX protease family)
MDLLIVGVSLAMTYLVAHSLGSANAGIYATLVGILICTWRLAIAHSSWRALGFRAPKSWPRTIVLSIALLVASELAGLLIVGPLARAANWPPLDISRFAGLGGNWHALLGWLLVAWTSAAIGEELIFRGFLISRLQTLWGETRVATLFAIVTQAICFGVAHLYLGQRGVVTATVIGLLYGAVYVGTGRQLPILVLAHGATDSTSLIAIYAGAVQS